MLNAEFMKVTFFSVAASSRCAKLYNNAPSVVGASRSYFSGQQRHAAKLHFMNWYHPTHPAQQAVTNKVALPLL